MNTLLLTEDALDDNVAGLGTVTREVMRKRAIDLAMCDDWSEIEAFKSAWEQAKQEMDELYGDQMQS